jgi:hypothetical protein
MLQHKSETCWNTNAETRLLERRCWNTALDDVARIEEASKEPVQKIKENAGIRKAEERIKEKGNYSWS